MVRMRRRERYDDHGVTQDGTATVTVEVFPGLDEVAAHVECTYRSGSWVGVLDAGHEADADLHRAWVPERIGRDFLGASIYNRDLAHAAGYFDARSLPAPGRALPDWHDHAIDALAAHLQAMGFEVSRERPEVLASAEDSGNPVLGALCARRYGYEVVAIARVDSCGEIYVRVADSDEVSRTPFQPVSADDGYG